MPGARGDVRCGQGALISRSVASALFELVQSADSPLLETAPAAATKSTWFCPRCGDSAVGEGFRVACPSCGLSLSPILRELIELNPHVPAPSPPEEVRVALELHDSALVLVTARAVTLTAYVHRWVRRHGNWTGTGWLQDYRFDFFALNVPELPPLPQDLAGGRLVFETRAHENLIHYPMHERGMARLLLELTSGGVLELRGELRALRAAGDARFVEVLPGDLGPRSDAG